MVARVVGRYLILCSCQTCQASKHVRPKGFVSVALSICITFKVVQNPHLRIFDTKQRHQLHSQG